jgi:hypothetical protein
MATKGSLTITDTLCRREAIAESLYYAWSKEFLDEARARHGFKRCAER